MQTVISLVLAILLCELLSVRTLQNNMTTQARNFVEAQAGTNANVVNEWLVEEGNIEHDPQRYGIYEHEGYRSDHGLSGSESGEGL